MTAAVQIGETARDRADFRRCFKTGATMFLHDDGIVAHYTCRNTLKAACIPAITLICAFHLGRLRYPRIAALAFAAALVIAIFAGLAPETTAFTPIMKASRMDRESGWKRNALARSTSAFCKLVSAASAACAPNAFLKPSLDQAETR